MEEERIDGVWCPYDKSIKFPSCAVKSHYFLSERKRTSGSDERYPISHLCFRQQFNNNKKQLFSAANILIFHYGFISGY